MSLHTDEMVDILLIQPPIRDFYLTAKRTIPYGLTAIAAALIAKGYTVDILDALAHGTNMIGPSILMKTFKMDQAC